VDFPSIFGKARRQMMVGKLSRSKFAYAIGVHRFGAKKKNKKRLQYMGRPMLFVIGLPLLLLMSFGCRKKASVPVPPPVQSAAKLPPDSAPSAITPSVVSSSKPVSVEATPAPKVPVVPNALDLGIISFKAGHYEKAAQLFEDYLGAGSNSENRDLALFHLFLSRTLMGNAGRNPRRAEDALKRLASEFPKSPYKDSAELVLGLQAQIESLKLNIKENEIKIKQLSEELQKLKEIDMQRRPSRPPD
jgi:hypothetical protein